MAARTAFVPEAVNVPVKVDLCLRHHFAMADIVFQQTSIESNIALEVR